MRTSAGVVVTIDPADSIASTRPVRWAVAHLRESLAKRGIPTGSGLNIYVRSAHGDAEATIVNRQIDESGTVLSISGSDPRGVVYAVTDIADIVNTAADPLDELSKHGDQSERPANAIRSCMRMFCSKIEDVSWYNDRDFWRQYLTMLVVNRFNRFQLAFGLGYDFVYHSVRDSYTHFPYPFLLKVPGYDVRATNFDDAERDGNLEMLRFISDEASLRGLQFQLGLWNHGYDWPMGEGVNHMIEGLTPETHASYCRDALAILLKQCPAITGLTFRIHGEGGITEGNYDFWKTIFDAPVKCGRRIEIDLHAKGIDQGMIDTALATGLPITVSPKYWAEHMGLPYHQAWIRPTELPSRERGGGPFAFSTGSRSFIRYGYGDLMREDRKFGVIHRMWPGTQRVLLWGDPTFAAAFGRASSFCGSLGCELMEPLSFKGRKGSGIEGHRTGYIDPTLAPQYDFEKYEYTYRLWGRLSYNPNSPPEVWQRLLRSQYGETASEVETALAHASRILPLFTTAHMPSAANNNYWPEMYVNMPIVTAGGGGEPYGDTVQPRKFGTVSPLDPQLFSRIDDYVDELIRREPSGKYSPIEVAGWLDELSGKAAEALARAESLDKTKTPAFRRFAIDAAIQIDLGRFFAHKLRAGVAYAIFEKMASRDALSQAIELYTEARQDWTRIIDRTQGVYAEDLSFGVRWFQRGHWSDRLAAIDQDIAAMRARANTPATNPDKPVGPAPSRQSITVEHTPPALFHAAQPIALDVVVSPSVGRVRLHYRHVNQAEPWQMEEMRREDGRHRATIPAEYTDSPYPLQYYFEMFRDAPPGAALYPGFNSTWSNQPYFVIRRA